MDEIENALSGVMDYFHKKFEAHGATPQGVDWNSTPAQEIRFHQVLKICDFSDKLSVIDFGCGYGGIVDTMEALGVQFTYIGYDPLQKMIDAARDRHAGKANYKFTSQIEELQPADYVVASGLFNVKLDTTPHETWTAHVLRTLDQMNELSRKGFSFNCLTNYSDAGRMRPDLYYADPCLLFHHCKIHYAKNVALLHDYTLYDFTILVRKDSA